MRTTIIIVVLALLASASAVFQKQEATVLQQALFGSRAGVGVATAGTCTSTATSAIATTLINLCDELAPTGFSLAVTATEASLSFSGGAVSFSFALPSSITGLATTALSFTATATLNEASTNPAMKIFATAVGGSVTLSFTKPASGPIVISLLLGTYVVGSTSITGTTITLTLPSSTVLPDMASTGSPCTTVPSGAMGLSVSMNVACKIGTSPVTFTGQVAVAIGSTVPTFSVCLGYTGIISSAFGLSGLSISNVAGSLTASVVTPYLTGVTLSGTVAIGTWSVTAAFGFSTNPSLDYMYLSLNSGLTVGTVLSALGGLAPANVPAALTTVGFSAGSWFAYSVSAQTLTSGIAIPAGITSKGAVTFWGSFTVTYSLAITPSPLSVSASMLFPVVKIGTLLTIYGSSALGTVGPSLALTVAAGAFSASGAFWLVCPEVATGAGGTFSITAAAGSTFAFTASFHADIVLAITATIPAAGATTGVSFTGSFTAAAIAANPVVVAALEKFGATLPAVPAIPLCTYCSDYDDFKSALTTVTAASLADLGLEINVSGTLGGGASSFSVTVEFTDMGFGPYTVSYTAGETFAAQFSTWGTEIVTDVEDWLKSKL